MIDFQDTTLQRVEENQQRKSISLMNWHSTAYVNKLAAFRKLLALNLKASCLFMWAVKKCLHLKKQLISFTGFLKRRREMKIHYGTRKLHNYYNSRLPEDTKSRSTDQISTFRK